MSSYLFNHDIYDWHSWSLVFHSTEAFEPLIRQIYENESLPFESIQRKDPGTHGVFQVGNTMIKVFVPVESGYDCTDEIVNEMEGLLIAKSLGLHVPKVIVSNTMMDRYVFRYIILEYVNYPTLKEAKETMSDSTKYLVGQKIREIVSSLRQYESHQDDYLNRRVLSSSRWIDAPESLKQAQKRVIEASAKDSIGFVHADLTADNILFRDEHEIVLLDFADKGNTLAIVEEMPLICDAFSFDYHFLQGFYKGLSIKEISQRCVDSLLVHEFGYHTINQLFGHIESYEELKKAVEQRLGIHR